MQIPNAAKRRSYTYKEAHSLSPTPRSTGAYSNAMQILGEACFGWLVGEGAHRHDTWVCRACSGSVLQTPPTAIPTGLCLEMCTCCLPMSGCGKPLVNGVFLGCAQLQPVRHCKGDCRQPAGIAGQVTLPPVRTISTVLADRLRTDALECSEMRVRALVCGPCTASAGSLRCRLGHGCLTEEVTSSILQESGLDEADADSVVMRRGAGRHIQRCRVW